MMLLPSIRSQSVTQVTKALTLLLGGQIIIAFVGLLLGKVTAVYIKPAKLGDYNLGLSGLNLAYVVLIVPILQAFKTEQVQIGALSAFSYYRKLIGWVYGLLVGVLFLFGYVHHQLGMALLVSLAGIGQGFYAGSTDYLNLAGKQRLYTGFQVGYALTNLILFAVLVIYFRQTTALGLWLCLAIANSFFAIMAFTTSVRVSSVVKPVLPHLTSRPNWSSFWSYAAPLVVLSLWGWTINYGDRYLISLYLAEEDVGQYSMGYSLGSKLLILVSPFVVHSTRQVYGLRAANVPINVVWKVQRWYLFRYVGLAACCCLGYYLMRNELGLLLLSATYRQAFQIGPIIATGYLFLTLIHLLEVQWYAYGFTKLILWTNIVGAIANVLLNILLIPRFGLIGAAYASLLGFLLQFLTACYFYISRLRTMAAYTHPPQNEPSL